MATRCDVLAGECRWLVVKFAGSLRSTDVAAAMAKDE